MPTYTLRHIESGVTEDRFLSISKMEELTSPQGGYEQLIGAPKIIYEKGDTLSRTDSGWNDVLKKIKSGAGKLGPRANTIETK
jgi:hypothetical protein